MPTFPERGVLMRPRPIIQALLLCSFVSFSAVADDDDDDSGVPGFIKGPILHQIYDGITAEQDSKHLLDGVAVSEPNVNPKSSNAFSIAQGSQSPVTNHSKSLYDYTTQVNLFQPCANLAASNASAPLNLVSDTFEGNRCQSQGLLTAATRADQANEAQAIINSFGILTGQNIVQPSHYFLSVPQSISVTYANAYGKLSVADNLCGYSFGATDVSCLWLLIHHFVIY
jgi:hypothetical protein